MSFGGLSVSLWVLSAVVKQLPCPVTWSGDGLRGTLGPRRSRQMKWGSVVSVQNCSVLDEHGCEGKLKEVVLFDPSEHGSDMDGRLSRVVMDDFIGHKLRPHQIEG